MLPNKQTQKTFLRKCSCEKADNDLLKDGELLLKNP